MYDKSQFYGSDPEYSRQASQQMDATAENLKGLVGSISSMLEQVTWVGGDAQRFVGDWNGALRPELDAATENLRENAAELARRAEMQEQASR